MTTALKLLASGLPALLIAAAFGVGLFFTGGASWLYAPALLLLLAGLLAAALPGLWRGRALPRSAPALGLLAFIAYATLSLAWSLAPFPSLITWLVLCALPLTFFACGAASDDTLRAIRAALLAGLGLLALAGVAQAWLHHGRPAWPLQDANNLAALCNLGFFPALALAWTAEGRWARRGGLAVALILFAGLLASGSRAGMLTWAGTMAILLWQCRRAAPRRDGLVLLAGLAGAAVLLAPVALGHLATLGLWRDAAALNRPILWRATLGMIAEHPWTGTGLGSFYLAYAGHRPDADRVSVGQWAHNDLLQFAAEMGIAAPLLFLVFLLTIHVRQTRVKGRCPDGRARLAAIAPLYGIFTLILHAQVEFQLYLLPTLIVAGAWLALWQRDGEALLNDAPPPLRAGARRVHAGAAVAVALLLAVPIARAGLGQYWLNRALPEIQAGHPQRFLACLDRADAVAPGSFIDARVQRASLYIDLLRTPNGIFSPSEQRTMSAYILSTLTLAEREMPLWYDVNAKRAALYLAMRDRLDPDWRAVAAAQLRLAIRKNHRDDDDRAALAALEPQR